MKRIVPYIFFIFLAIALIGYGDSYGLSLAFQEFQDFYKFWIFPISSFQMNEILVFLLVGLFVPKMTDDFNKCTGDGFDNREVEYLVLFIFFFLLFFIYPIRILIEVAANVFDAIILEQLIEIPRIELRTALFAAMILGFVIAAMSIIDSSQGKSPVASSDEKMNSNTLADRISTFLSGLIVLLIIALVPSSIILMITLGTLLPSVLFAMILHWYFDIIWTIIKSAMKFPENESD